MLYRLQTLVWLLCLSRSNSSRIIHFVGAWRLDTAEFSREFGSLLRPKYCLAWHLALNSRENLIPISAFFHRDNGWSSEFGQGKQLLYSPFSDCVRTLLSPSCHPCHPQKRVQTPCTSAFCHPDTLFSKKINLYKRFRHYFFFLSCRTSSFNKPCRNNIRQPYHHSRLANVSSLTSSRPWALLELVHAWKCKHAHIPLI